MTLAIGFHALYRPEPTRSLPAGSRRMESRHSLLARSMDGIDGMESMDGMDGLDGLEPLDGIGAQRNTAFQ